MQLRTAIHFALILPLTAALPSTAFAADWTQFGYDAAHTGFNTAETTIDASNVASLTSAFAGGVALPAKVDGAPVYKSGVTTPNGVRDLLFAFGSDGISDFSASIGTLMAIDAQTGQLVWSKETDGTSHNSSQHASSSPAIDPDGQYVYSFGLDGYVHKYAIGDGTEITDGGPTGWPQQVTLKPNVEKSASSLTIAPMGGVNYLVAVTDGYNGDGGDYQGHLVSINLASGAKIVFNFMCSDVPTLLADGGCSSGRESGAWGRGGATYDAGSGRIFATSGNGHFDADTNGTNWGDSVLAFTPDGGSSGNGAPLDSYTPSNFQQLEDQDQDLGSVSLAVLKAPAGSAVAHIGLQTGKDAQVHLLDLDDLSGAGGPRNVGGEIQSIDLPQGGSGPRAQQAAVWRPADGSSWVYLTNTSGISAFQITLDGSQRPQLTQRWMQSGSMNSPVLSNDVLFVAGACTGGTCITARDPVSGNVLWSSDHIGGLHWQSPIVVDGAVYMIDGGSKLWKFSGPAGDTDPIFADGFDG